MPSTLNAYVLRDVGLRSLRSWASSSGGHQDRDFRDGHLLSGSPRHLLVVATGNITNAALLALFEVNLDAVVDALGDADFVELGPETMVVHRRREDPSS